MTYIIGSNHSAYNQLICVTTQEVLVSLEYEYFHSSKSTSRSFHRPINQQSVDPCSLHHNTDYIP